MSSHSSYSYSSSSYSSSYSYGAPVGVYNGRFVGWRGCFHPVVVDPCDNFSYGSVNYSQFGPTVDNGFSTEIIFEGDIQTGGEIFIEDEPTTEIKKQTPTNKDQVPTNKGNVLEAPGPRVQQSPSNVFDTKTITTPPSGKTGITTTPADPKPITVPAIPDTKPSVIQTTPAPDIIKDEPTQGSLLDDVTPEVLNPLDAGATGGTDPFGAAGATETKMEKVDVTIPATDDDEEDPFGVGATETKTKEIDITVPVTEDDDEDLFGTGTTETKTEKIDITVPTTEDDDEDPFGVGVTETKTEKIDITVPTTEDDEEDPFGVGATETVDLSVPAATVNDDEDPFGTDDDLELDLDEEEATIPAQPATSSDDDDSDPFAL